jgi:hypothetical protein
VSLWLNSGVPATEVARRATHGVAVLLKIYAHCIDGQADAVNQRITDALGTTEADHGPAAGDLGGGGDLGGDGALVGGRAQARAVRAAAWLVVVAGDGGLGGVRDGDLGGGRGRGSRLRGGPGAGRGSCRRGAAGRRWRAGGRGRPRR